MTREPPHTENGEGNAVSTTVTSDKRTRCGKCEARPSKASREERLTTYPFLGLAPHRGGGWSWARGGGRRKSGACESGGVSEKKGEIMVTPGLIIGTDGEGIGVFRITCELL